METEFKIDEEVEWDIAKKDGGVAWGRIMDILEKTETKNVHLVSSSYMIISPFMAHAFTVPVNSKDLRRRRST